MPVKRKLGAIFLPRGHLKYLKEKKINKRNIIRWNRDNNFHSPRQVLRVKFL